MDISQNNDDFVKAAENLGAVIMEESAEMARLQQARGLVDHVTGTATKIDKARMEESSSMARFQT